MRCQYAFIKRNTEKASLRLPNCNFEKIRLAIQLGLADG